MKKELTAEEIKDIQRGLVIAMHTLDETKNGPDIQLSNRLEIISKKLDEPEQ